ncbi:hypothetical protein CTAYLR_002726 [Chrysophaeum taylorii]|uniref:Plastid lipid-associated protein/fibrillin conserved domain-containing protein n=1 Tax=Chrysophaeum taylorii TaxID=2483200 RepID=A0AAD7UCM2_9STRA|nr:hypothetical protein CTAYLR_002726 [Chrysophaeum taylorii]
MESAGEVDAAKRDLLLALAVTDRGFKASASQQANVREKIDRLAEYSSTASIEGNWTLAWTDAPDILGLSGGPLGVVGRVGQVISADTIVNVIEYEPVKWLPLSTLALQQRVILNYTRDGNEVVLTLRGVGGRARPPFGGAKAEFGKPVDVVGPGSLPFGRFRILYNDGDLRIVRTAQGYFSVNLKEGPADETTTGAED